MIPNFPYGSQNQPSQFTKPKQTKTENVELIVSYFWKKCFLIKKILLDMNKFRNTSVKKVKMSTNK